MKPPKCCRIRFRILLIIVLAALVFGILLVPLLKPGAFDLSSPPETWTDLLQRVTPDPSRALQPGKPRIVGFYHFWFGESDEELTNAMGVFSDQINQVTDSFTFKNTSAIFVNMIGNPNNKGVVASNFTARLKDTAFFFHELKGFEDSTLQKLHKYCMNHTEDIVWYIHNKGAWHTQANQVAFRQSTTNFTLRRECLEQVQQGFDACGFRFTPFPHRHFPGNTWIARCKYINTLTPEVSMPTTYDPCPGDARNFKFMKNGEMKTSGCISGCFRFDRFFHEHWIGSNPWANISDCLGYTKVGQEYITYMAQYGRQDWQTIPIECTAAPKPELVDAWLRNMSLFPGVDPWVPDVLAGQRGCHQHTYETDKIVFGPG